jgi:hypothetical protein
VPVRVLQQPVQRRTPSFGTRDSVVGVLINDLKSTLARKLAELVQLSFRVLVEGRDSDVKAGTLHADTSCREQKPAAVPLREAVKVLCRRA